MIKKGLLSWFLVHGEGYMMVALSEIGPGRKVQFSENKVISSVPNGLNLSLFLPLVSYDNASSLVTQKKEGKESFVAVLSQQINR